MSIETVQIDDAEGRQFEAFRAIESLLPETLNDEELVDLLSMILLGYTAKETAGVVPLILAKVLRNVFLNFEERDEQ